MPTRCRSSSESPSPEASHAWRAAPSRELGVHAGSTVHGGILDEAGPVVVADLGRERGREGGRVEPVDRCDVGLTREQPLPDRFQIMPMGVTQPAPVITIRRRSLIPAPPEHHGGVLPALARTEDQHVPQRRRAGRTRSGLESALHRTGVESGRKACSWRQRLATAIWMVPLPALQLPV